MRGGHGNLVARMEGTGWNGGTKKCVELVCYGVERYYMGGLPCSVSCRLGGHDCHLFPLTDQTGWNRVAG